jgi:hypothetical protein
LESIAPWNFVNSKIFYLSLVTFVEISTAQITEGLTTTVAGKVVMMLMTIITLFSARYVKRNCHSKMEINQIKKTQLSEFGINTCTPVTAQSNKLSISMRSIKF